MNSENTKDSTLLFKKNQKVVYPLQGVGRIVSIEEKEFEDQTIWYYIIALEVADMTVGIPVKKAEDVGLRPIVDKSEAEKALKFISEEYEPLKTDWKMRYQMNLDFLKKGSVMDIANVVRALYHRSKIKELPAMERRLFGDALKLLVAEISFSLEISKQEVEKLIYSKLETDHLVSDDIDDEHSPDLEDEAGEADEIGEDLDDEEEV